MRPILMGPSFLWNVLSWLEHNKRIQHLVGLRPVEELQLQFLLRVEVHVHVRVPVRDYESLFQRQCLFDLNKGAGALAAVADEVALLLHVELYDHVHAAHPDLFRGHYDIVDELPCRLVLCGGAHVDAPILSDSLRVNIAACVDLELIPLLEGGTLYHLDQKFRGDVDDFFGND